MKKILSAVMLVAIMLSTTACSSTNTNTESQTDSQTTSRALLTDLQSETVSSESLYQQKIKNKTNESKNEESKSESKAESKSESKTESKTESKEESKAESEAESKSESKTVKIIGGTSSKIEEDGEYTYEGVTLNLPQGYYIYSKNSYNDGVSVVVTVPEDYPDTIQMVTFTTMNGMYAHSTKEELEEVYNNSVEGFGGFTYFRDYSIDGYDAQEFTYLLTNSNGATLNMGGIAIYFNNKVVLIDYGSEINEDNSQLTIAMSTIRIPI